VSIPRYGRWSKEFDRRKGIDRVEFTRPDGSVETRPTYSHQPAELRYDHHGYEAVVPKGELVLAVRFTPVQVGIYRYRAMSGQDVVEEGQFDCELSDHPGYVVVSSCDSRYFACSDGSWFCPIGLNIVGPPRYPLPRGMAHFDTSEEYATLGCFEYRRWFRKLARAGGNYARIWLSNPYFEVETEAAGDLDLVAFARIDAVIELARQYGIRLKLCFEHFRTLEPGSPFFKVLRHPEDGRSPSSMAEWFQEQTWRELWLRKVRAYIARYGGDPTVMAWELWNEINCCQTGNWEIQRDWTRDILREIKRMAPRQLVVNSIGSFDRQEYQRWYDDFCMDEMDFQQAHRYLDQGASWDICTLDPVAFSVDAIQRTRRPDRPIMLAETGAVNDRHTGPFRFYRMDNRGIIFHDTTFPAFFAGAAGTGQIWHWDQYVDQKDLWGSYRPFADLVAGIQGDDEGFLPVDLSTDRAWFLGLRGNDHLLAWVRNKVDSWHAVLRDEIEPEILRDQVFDLTGLGISAGKVQLYWPWQEADGEAKIVAGRLRLPPFRYGLMVKVRMD